MIIIKEFISLTISLAGIILVLLLTYYGTKWLSSKAGYMTRSKYMNITDKIVLGQNKYLAVVEISNKYYLMSIADNGINILKELEEPMPADEGNGNSPAQGVDFSGVLTNMLKNIRK